MKKKFDAFAFQDFNEKKNSGKIVIDKQIFNRPYFKSFKFSSFNYDAQKDSLNVSINYRDLEKVIVETNLLRGRFKNFLQFLERHIQRLQKIWRVYGRRVDSDKKSDSKSKYERAGWLVRQYSEFVDFTKRLFDIAVSTNKNVKIKFEERYRKEFGKRLAEARRAAGLTQKELAEVLGITPSGYARYEQGRVDLSTASLKKFVQVTNCSVEKLLGLAD